MQIQHSPDKSEVGSFSNHRWLYSGVWRLFVWLAGWRYFPSSHTFNAVFIATSVAAAVCQLCLAAGDKLLPFRVLLSEVTMNVTVVRQETSTRSCACVCMFVLLKCVCIILYSVSYEYLMNLSSSVCKHIDYISCHAWYIRLKTKFFYSAGAKTKCVEMYWIYE